MKKLISIFISFTTLILFFLLLTGCKENIKKLTFRTIVDNNVQISAVYDYGTIINEPKILLTEGQKFYGWYLDGKKVNFPLTLKLNTTLVAKTNENIDPAPVPDPQPIPDNPEFKIDYNSLKTEFNGYYKGITATNNKELFEQLSKLLNQYPYTENTTYNQVWSIVREADIRPEVSSNYISGIYGYYFERKIDGKMIRKLSPDGNEKTYNREHVWPQSRLSISREEKASYVGRGIATDAHNLRASGVNINKYRGNLDFEDGTGRAHLVNGGFYPGDMSKGDVARILLYMAVRYKDRLKLSKNARSDSYVEGHGELGNLELLKRWSYEDKVDQLERNRNNVIFNYQKNRNPFIDHPEWVPYIWSYLMELDK